MSYDHLLSADEKGELLRIARASLKEYLLTGRLPPGKPHRECMVAPAAVFVSLYTGDKLRGCIGTTDEDRPLYKAIQETVVGAASGDPRFPGVTLDDLPDLHIEIAVLSGLEPVRTPSDVDIGVHGVAIADGERRGVILPDVPSAQGWDSLTFLGKACQKAGSLVDAWKQPSVRVERFTAQQFDERSFPPPPSPLRLPQP